MSAGVVSQEELAEALAQRARVRRSRLVRVLDVLHARRARVTEETKNAALPAAAMLLAGGVGGVAAAAIHGRLAARRAIHSRSFAYGIGAGVAASLLAWIVGRATHGRLPPSRS